MWYIEAHAIVLNKLELLLKKQIAKEGNLGDISTTGVCISHKTDYR